MSQKDQFSALGPFSPAHQLDEGYSEDPINPTIHDDLAALSGAGFPSHLSSWLASNASRLPTSVKTELTMALLQELPTSAIADIVRRLNPRLYIDFIRYLPPEVCLKILGHLDPLSLVSVMRTCRAWYDLALDRKLWERLYYMEGWKAVQSEIEVSETKVNADLNSSISHLHRIPNSDGHTSKIRAIPNDEDAEMTDGDRFLNANEGGGSESIFGSPQSVSTRRGITPMGEMDIDGGSSKSMRSDRTPGSSDSKGKRKEPGGDPSTTLPPILPSASAAESLRSKLWMWDISSSRYRINWKYIYNMRRRLEGNWDLGKFATFQLPHPLHPEEGHVDCVYTLQFDRNYVVSGSRDKTMRIWDIHTRRLARPPLTGHAGSVLCLQFDADPAEDLLVSGSSDSNIFIWKFSTGELLQKITRAHRESVLNIRFDKRILVTASRDKTIKIFNRRPLHPGDMGYGYKEMPINTAARNMKRYGVDPDPTQDLPIKPPFTMIGRLDGHTAAVNAIQVRDSTIVSVSGDRHIKVWNWPDQVCTRTIPAHTKGIACVDYDGRRIVSGSSDCEVCVFDAPTGLKVAQLRGHGNLVRTVQVGFADLPYSEEEDEAEARAVDANYYRAVEAGEVSAELDHSRPNRRRANAGSSLPQDVIAVGAKLPPGGGGGRKYGRIVSGSYDQTIIIWRRDKEGVWKPAHHLRHDEAAASAWRRAAASVGSLPPIQPGSMRRTVFRSWPALPPVAQGENTQQLPSLGQLPQMINLPLGSPLSAEDVRAPVAYRAIIDQAVSVGAGALQQALIAHPGALSQHEYLQLAIEREASPFARSQLRQVMATALLAAAQNSQPPRSNSGPGGPPLLGLGGSAPVPSSSAAATDGSSSSQNQGEDGGAGSGGAGPSQPTSMPTAEPQQAFDPTVLGGDRPTQTPVQGLPPAMPSAGPPQDPAAPPEDEQPQPAMQNAAGFAAVAHRHPHLPAEDRAPWVFKLQFDARCIVCCSKTLAIVGWDFCNGDRELEEASRFFATVE